MNEESSPATEDIGTPALDPARQSQAKRYARIRRTLTFVDLGIDVVLLGVIFALGLHLWLRDRLIMAGLAQWQPVAGWSPLLLAAVAGIVLLGGTVLGLPLSYYRGFVLPHRYGMSRQTVRGWLADVLKGFVLSFAFGIAAIDVLYLLLTLQPQTWWLWAAGLLLLLNVVLANLLPVLILPLFYKLTPMADGEIKQRLLAMAERAHTRVQGVYVMTMSDRTNAGNAALMGLGNTRRIVVGDTIMQQYTPDEIEVILAHELGHHVHQDIWKLVISSTILTLGGLALVNVGLHAAANATGVWHFTGINDIANLPLLVALFGIYGFVTGPLGNTYSRIIEKQADAYALTMTSNPTAFIDAFTRLANQNLAQLDPGPVVEALFYDHPAISKRIAHAEQWMREQKQMPVAQHD